MDSLPNEIILKILEYLPTVELIYFCEVFDDLDYFLKEKVLIRNSHWSKRFDLQGMDICKIIPAKMDISLIKVLNINYLHWIPVEDLRELIYRLYNLDELQAMDTTIGLCESDIRLYLRLTKLAISVCRTSFEPPETWRTLKEQRLFNIKIFCIKVYLEETFEREMMINYITKTMRLDELWVQDFLSRDHQTNYDDLVIRMVSLDRVILSFVSAILPVYEFSTWGLYTVFATQRCQSASELIFEKLETPPPDDQMVKVNPPVTALDKAWRRFKLLHSFPACGVEEYKSLHLNEDLNMVDFKELDFCHSQNSCSYPFCKSAMEVLLTPNVTKLKKLQIKSCLWLPKKSKRVVEEGEEEPEEEAEEDYDLDDDSDNDSEEYVLEVKKPRFDVTPEPVELHPFYDVATNIKDLSELEIFVCTSRRCHRPRVINAFRFIEIFTRLKRLLLKIHLMTEGKYFKDVFAKCEMLESLSIKLTINDDDFMMDLVRHIKDSKSLKDFKLEYGELDVDELFDGLNQITNKNMQRLVLKCDVLYFSKSISLTEPFCTFLERNPQLVLFYVVAYKASNEEMNVINEAISKYHKVWKTLYSGTEDKFSIQYAHYDIIDNPNRVGSVDFDRF